MATPTTLTKSILKRKSDDEDSVSSGVGTPSRSFDDRAYSNAAKRRKVAFDLSGNRVLTIGPRRFLDVRREVTRALNDHATGNSERYDQLKGYFGARHRSGGQDDEAPSSEELRLYIRALADCAARLGKPCDGLIKALLHMRWLGRPESFVAEYRGMLGSIVTVHGAYVGHVIDMLVSKFKLGVAADWTVPDAVEAPIDRATAFDRVHTTLEYLLRLAPLAGPIAAARAIDDNFPFMEDSRREHRNYVENLLRMRDYVPSLKHKIVPLIVQRLVKMDVQMQLDLGDIEDEVTSRVLHSLQQTKERASTKDSDDYLGDDDDYDSEDDDDDDDLADADEDDDEIEEEVEMKNVENIRRNIQKMDSMLNALFELYEPIFDDPASPEATAEYAALEDMFSTIILPTYNSRHTQFLLFRFAQKSPQLVERLCATFLKAALDKGRFVAVRQAAVAYLASFVARGARVSKRVVRECFAELASSAGILRDLHLQSCKGPDLRRFSIYYAMVQAMLYIFCFRWRQLIERHPDDVDVVGEEEGGGGEHGVDVGSYVAREHEWVGQLGMTLKRHIYSPLNPLKVCAPVIVEQFAEMAHHLQLVHVLPKIEENKRIRLSQFATGSYGLEGVLRDAGTDGADDSWHQLEPHFPFDPYQLPATKHWVEGDYLAWEEIPGLVRREEGAERGYHADEENGDGHEEGDEDGE